MKLWIQSTLLTVLLLAYSGCSTTPTPKKEAQLDRTLPVIHLTKNGVFADMNAIAFEWNSIRDTKADGIYIYKKKIEVESNEHKLEYYKTIDNRFATHFVDNDIVPNTRYIYLFKTFKADKESIGSKVDVKSLPTLKSVTWIHSITGMPKSAKIIWRPHTNQKVQYYIIERKEEGDTKFKEVAKIEGRLNAEFIDSDLDNDSVYYYRIRVKTFDDLLSTPSQVVRAVTKELPKSINYIKASTNLVKKIRISWQPTTIPDFQYYAVYKSSQKNSMFKLFKKTKVPYCIDKLYEDGEKYFYRVSVVDKDGLESFYAEHTAMGMSLAKPTAPYDIRAKLLGSVIELEWNDNDSRVKSYTVERKENDGWFKYRVKEYKNIRQNHFTDNTIEPNKVYKYSVFAVDTNGIVSERSREIEVETSMLQKMMKIQNGKTVMTIEPKRPEVIPDTVEDETVSVVDDLQVDEN